MVRKPTVLIVGAGPAGLVLAISLLKSGIPIRIIDKLRAPDGGARGTAVQPRTLEMLAFLGVVHDVFAISTLPLLMATHGTGQEVVKLGRWEQEADPSPNIPYPRLASASQAEFSKVLRKHVEMMGAKVEFGVELTSFEQYATGVVAHLLVSSESGGAFEEMVECAYMVGADGAKGRTRKNLGLSFLGETREAERMWAANVDVKGLDREYWHIWGTFSTAVFYLKPLEPAPMFQAQALGPNLPQNLPTDTEGIQKLFESISGSKGITLSNPTWVSEWRTNIRMASSYSAGRVFLAGDSAHCHSPAGAQGGNTAMHDGFNLAWKLALVINGLASPALLKTYEIERRPVAEEMHRISSMLHSLAFAPPPASAPGAGGETRNDQVMFRPKQLLQLGINYRWSPIVLEARPGEHDMSADSPYGQEATSVRVRAGDRAPDATPLVDADDTPRGVITLHSTFSVDRHTILAFLAAEEAFTKLEHLNEYVDVGLARISVIHRLVPGREIRLKGSRALIDVEGTAHIGYNVQGDEISLVVIRPDGVIGAYTHNIADIGRYFAAVQGLKESTGNVERPFHA